MGARTGWMGESVLLSLEVWAEFKDEFSFHDAVFTGAEFGEDGDPRLRFDCALVEGSAIRRVPVVVTLRGTVDLRIAMPRDWVMDLQVTPTEGSREFRWTDAMTGTPMVEAKASEIEVSLDATPR